MILKLQLLLIGSLRPESHPEAFTEAIGCRAPVFWTQVFGANAGRNAASLAKDSESIGIGTSLVRKEQARLASIGGDLDPVELTRNAQETMWEKVGVVRDKINLQKAIAKLVGRNFPHDSPMLMCLLRWKQPT